MNTFLRDRLSLFTFVAIIFILGIIFGSIAVKTVEYHVKQSLFSYFNNFMSSLNNLEYDHHSLVSESIRFNLFNIAIIWAFVISVFLMSFITLLIFFKGFVMGFTVGFLVSEYGYKGIMITLTAIFPQNILIIPTYILAGVMGIYLSIWIIKYYWRIERLNFQHFLKYSFDMAVLAFILFGGSIIETYISPYLNLFYGLLVRHLSRFIA
ncbi:MAG: stage II sporulation protein M [Thermotogota bacterium]|nr:stage II sporulation protein M [Thermotogota bacterium]